MIETGKIQEEDHDVTTKKEGGNLILIAGDTKHGVRLYSNQCHNHWYCLLST